MRLVAVFIKGHFLFEEDQIINFGGEYIYDFKTIKDNIEITRKKNKQFIETFFGENISLVSAIVGDNGAGKTSLINTILLNINNKNIGIIDCNLTILIFETKEKVIIYSRNYNVKNEILINYINFNKSKQSLKISTIFYTPILDIRELYINHSDTHFIDLSKYRFFQNDTEQDDGSFTALSEFHLSENLKRWIVFRNHFQLDFDINFANIPKFDSIKININRVFSLMNKSVDQISRDFRPFMKEFYSKWQKEYHNKSSNRRKLELNILLSVIEKVFKILEETGNTYLEEGKVKIKVTEIKNLNLKDAFYKFLEEHYYIKYKNVKLPVKEIKELIETLINNLPENENDLKSHGWDKYNTDFNRAIKIINAYQNFISAFSKHFTYDKSILLTFKTDKDLSSGEKGLLDLFSSFIVLKMN